MSEIGTQLHQMEALRLSMRTCVDPMRCSAMWSVVQCVVGPRV